MSLINMRDRTIAAKIVYYGTALSGKTTSLQHVHRVVDPEQRTELVSLNTDGDRTLFFDFLPIPLGNLGGFQVKLQAFTVPGQVKYAVTRRYVLRGADGVVFVADSAPDAMDGNHAALDGLRENLIANGLDPARIPLFIQYNKRDVPRALPVEAMRAALNSSGAPDLPTVATTGEGVFESFSQLCGDVLESLAAEYRIADPSEVRDQLANKLALLEREYAQGRVASQGLVARAGGRLLVPEAAVESDERASVIHTPSDSPVEGPPDEGELLEQALSANMEAARLLADLHETRRDLSEHVRQLAALHETGTAIAGDLDTEGVLRQVLGAALEAVGTDWGAVVLRNVDTGRVSARLARGGEGPLGATVVDSPAVATRLLDGEPFALEAAALGPDPRVAMALVAPLHHQGEALGALVAYARSVLAPETVEARLRFLGAIASHASVALVNARLYERIESFNRELERKVAERTQELERAYTELRELDALKDDFLASMSHELLTPLTSIAGFAEILCSTAGEDGETAAAERREFASIVHVESARLTTMLQSVLDLSMLESGQAQLARKPLVVRDLLRDAHATLRERGGANGATIRVRMQEGLPPVAGDAPWVKRVLYELLSNACKFSPEGAPVVVTVSAGGCGVLVQVDDAGPGVAVEHRTAIFDKFKQVGDVLTDKPTGLGLGLPTAKLVVEHLGGTIDVGESESGGASFRVSFPLAGVPAAAR